MALATTTTARRLALALAAAVALACPACASKDKVASPPAGAMGMGGMGGMSAPPMTAAYDPARQQAAASPAGSPWGIQGGMPTASADAPTMR